DGHTLLLCPPGPIATNKFLFKDLAYDPARFVPISWLTTVPYVLIARTSFTGDFQALMAHAKANPGKVTAAMPGPGGTAHQGLEVARKARARDQHIGNGGEPGDR